MFKCQLDDLSLIKARLNDETNGRGLSCVEGEAYIVTRPSIPRVN